MLGESLKETTLIKHFHSYCPTGRLQYVLREDATRIALKYMKNLEHAIKGVRIRQEVYQDAIWC